MAFQWNVQPYQYLSELRAEYTTTVMLATRKQAYRLAAEAEQWMRDNAPWQDRPEELRNHLKREGFLPQDAIHAREGLQVVIETAKAEQAYETGGRAAAQREDMKALEKLNKEIKQRREAAEERVRQLSREGNRQAAIELNRRVYRQRQFKQRKSLPASQSALAAFERQWKSERSPLLHVTFRHGDERRVPYAIWLEIANQGRYAIISRAIDYWTPKFMVEIKRIANLKQYRDRIALSEDMVQLDQQTMLENISQEERFARNVQREERFSGETYRPWTPERQAESRRRSAQPARKRQRAETRAARRQNRAGY